MHGIAGFAEVIQQNSASILKSLTKEDKEKLYALLPEADAEFSGRYGDMTEIEYKESILSDLLTN